MAETQAADVQTAVKAGQMGSAIRDGHVKWLMQLGMTKGDIMKACQDIIDNNGAENYAKAKKVEIALSDMLSNGWTGQNREAHEANADYVSAKKNIEGAKENGTWEDYLAQHSFMLLDGSATEEQLRAEWEAQQAEAEENLPDKKEDSGRRYISYTDESAREKAFSEKAQSLVDNGKYIEITADEVNEQSGNADWGNLQAVRSYIRKTLQSIFGTESVFFEDNGAVVEAHLTREGRKHSATTVTNEAGAAAMAKARELVSKAEYVFSSDHDIHSKAGENIGSDTVWDYYEAIVKYGDSVIPVRYTLRNVGDDPRAQINKIGVNAERVSPNNRPPRMERPVDNGETLSEERIPQSAPPVNGQTPAESTNGQGPERERGMSRNLSENEKAEPELSRSFAEERDLYNQLTNKEVTDKADAILAKGYEAARNEVVKAVGKAQAGYKLAPEMALAGYHIANEMVRRGELEAARELCSDIAAELTAAGQVGQIGKLILAADPSIRIRTVDKIVDKIHSDGVFFCIRGEET